MSEIHDWTLEQIKAGIDEDRGPEGPWFSRYHCREVAHSNDAPYEPEQVVNATYTLVDEGEIMEWIGFLVPNERPYLIDAIEYERDRETPRQILIGKINKYLQDEIEEFAPDA